MHALYFRGPAWKGETGLLFSTPDKSAAFFSQAVEPILRERRKYMVRLVEPRVVADRDTRQAASAFPQFSR